MSIRFHSTNYLKREGREPGRPLLSRGFWFHQVPRVTVLCRVLGHRPVVDGTKGVRPDDPGSRWVCCDRCGVRPEPQGVLDPAVWDIGQLYNGVFDGSSEIYGDEMGPPRIERSPGSWPTSPTGTIGGQLVVGHSVGGVSVGVEVGAAGSEHTLSGHVRVNRLGALYLHTEYHGQRLQRRLIPEGYEDRAVDIGVASGRLSWRVWAPRDSWSSSTPKWKDGSVRIDPRDVLLGDRRYSYEDVEGPVTATVRMPEGDDHEVKLTLQRQRYGRKRGRADCSWSVKWWCDKGIPVRNHAWKGDGTLGSSVKVTDAAVRRKRWVQDACAAIAADMSRDRSHYGWRPSLAESGAA